MAGEYLKVPDEAKTFNDLVDWAAKNGQTESIKQLVEAAKAQDWDTALDAVHKLEDYAELADKTAAVGTAFDTLDKVGKALEIAEAVDRGDYAYASAKLGAEVVDSVASDYLNSLGPGGMVLNYAVHQGGEYASGKLSEYQQFGPDAEAAVAAADLGAVGAYKATKEVLDNGMQARMEAGASPAEAREWAQQYMTSHAAVWKNLETFEAGGAAFKDRFEMDLAWVEARSEAIGDSLSDAANTAADDAAGPSWLEGLAQQAGTTLKGWIDQAQEANASDSQAQGDQSEAAESRQDAPEEDRADPTHSRTDGGDAAPSAQPEPTTGAAPEVTHAQVAPEHAGAAEPELPDPTTGVQARLGHGPTAQDLPSAVQLEVLVSDGQAADLVAAERVPVEPVQGEPAPTEEAIAIEIPLTPPGADEPPVPTPVIIDSSALTETEKLDAYVSQMAREAEAQWAAETLADQAPPAPEAIVIDGIGDTEVVEAAPWIDEPAISETFDDQPDNDTFA
ncbi:MAG: hypothetical protein AAGG11_11665 [Pseudomonadota bacterium]